MEPKEFCQPHTLNHIPGNIFPSSYPLKDPQKLASTTTRRTTSKHWNSSGKSLARNVWGPVQKGIPNGLEEFSTTAYQCWRKDKCISWSDCTLSVAWGSQNGGPRPRDTCGCQVGLGVPVVDCIHSSAKIQQNLKLGMTSLWAMT